MANWVECAACGLKHSARADAMCPRCRAPAGVAGASAVGPAGLAPPAEQAVRPGPPSPADDASRGAAGGRGRAERVWPVLALSVLAFVGMAISAGGVALAVFGPRLLQNPEALGLPYFLVTTAAGEAFLLLFALALGRPGRVERLRLGRSGARPLTIAAVAIAAIAIGQIGDSIVAVLDLYDVGSIADFRRMLRGAGTGALLAAVVVVGVVAGTAEELFFRGFVQTGLARRWRASTAVVATSVLFGLVHLDPLHVALVIPVGLWLGFVTERTGSIRPAIVAHVANNVVAVVGARAGLSSPGVAPNVVAGAVAVLVLAFCARHVSRAHDPSSTRSPAPPLGPASRLASRRVLASAVALVTLVVVAVALGLPARRRASGTPLPARPPASVAPARGRVPASASEAAPGPCDTTLERFDPARVYEALGPAVRDVEDRGRVAFGIVGRAGGVWILGAELVHEEASGEPVQFRPDPFSPSAGRCYGVDGASNPDPPHDPEAARCAGGEIGRLVPAPDGGTVWECKRKPGELERLWYKLRGIRRGPPWKFFVLGADGSRVLLEPGTGLCRVGREGRLLLSEEHGLRVVDRDGPGTLAPLSCSRTTPIRATEDGFLVVDLDRGPNPVAWLITAGGARRVGEYPVGDGARRWEGPFAIDGSGRLYGVQDITPPGSPHRSRLVRMAPGGTEVEELAKYDDFWKPFALITGP